MKACLHCSSWAITRETRAYRKGSGLFNPLQIVRPTSAGGWDAWEVDYRYLDLDLRDGLVDGGELGIHSVSVNGWLTHVTQFSLNYRHTTPNQEGVEGDNSAIVGQLLRMLD